MAGMSQDKYLSDTELVHLEHVLKVWEGREERNVLMFRMLLHCGCRASELLHVERRDVNLEQKTVYIRGMKGSFDREIPLPERFMEPLTRIMNKSEDPNQRIFPMHYSRMWFIWTEYRPCEKGLHSLRHTAAIKLYKKTRDIKLVQIFLGHKSLSNTQIYVDFVYGQEVLRNALCESISDSTNLLPLKKRRARSSATESSTFCTLDTLTTSVPPKPMDKS